MILPNLPAFLDGKYRPQDNDERLALLGVCQFTDRTCAAARLYSDAFATDPLLAEDLRAGHRFQAARAAALAGCGLGLDGTKLSMAERTPWRRQAPIGCRLISRRAPNYWRASPGRPVFSSGKCSRIGRVIPAWLGCANRAPWTRYPRTNGTNASHSGKPSTTC